MIQRLHRQVPAPSNGRKRPRAATAHNAVLKGIGLAILSGEFTGGSALPSKEVLMRRFGVSNTPLREALQSLASKGLIAAKTKVGTWVRDEAHWNMFDPEILSWRLEIGIDQAFLAKLFEMRQTFEPVAAAIAATRRTEQQIADLLGLVEAMAEAMTDKQTFTEVDVALHLLVLTASNNPFMQSIGALIRTALAASFESSAPTDDPKRAILAVEQHARIVDAITRREPQAAADAMMYVIQQGWTNIGGRTDQLARLTTENFVLPMMAAGASISTLPEALATMADGSGPSWAELGPAVAGERSS